MCTRCLAQCLACGTCSNNNEKVVVSIGKFKVMTSGARAEIMHQDVRPLTRSKNPTPFVLPWAVQAAEVSWAGNKTCYLQG